jgi:molybdenum cofactor cytidylyltransferase
MALSCNVPLVILAAGLSTRMGRTKATLPLGTGDTFLTRILSSAAHADISDVVVVIGHDAEAVQADVAAHGFAPRYVTNRAYRTGQFSSVLAGLNAVDRPGVDGMLLTLVDVPLVAPNTIRAVVERHRRVRPPIVRAVRGGEHGHPVLIDRSLFDVIRSANPAEGLKPVVRAHASADGDVTVDDAGAFFDIDTPDAYGRALDMMSQD